MATIKSFTSLEQSRKLAEILPLESSDMLHCINFDGDLLATVPKQYSGSFRYNPELTIPCWSLAVLISILPSDFWGYNKHYFLEISKMGDISKYNEVRYYRFREQSDGADFGRITHISFQSDNLIDACYKMILNLHKLNLL